MNLVKKYQLEISQPAITSRRVPIHKITIKRNYMEVHKYVFGISYNTHYFFCGLLIIIA